MLLSDTMMIGIQVGKTVPKFWESVEEPGAGCMSFGI